MEPKRSGRLRLHSEFWRKWEGNFPPQKSVNRALMGNSPLRRDCPSLRLIRLAFAEDCELARATDLQREPLRQRVCRCLPVVWVGCQSSFAPRKSLLQGLNTYWPRPGNRSGKHPSSREGPEDFHPLHRFCFRLQLSTRRNVHFPHGFLRRARVIWFRFTCCFFEH